ncbi:MAG TPA: VOC family protein [Novosphingobium sp.]|nr:VOC family protein [Novosphingobium sp.]
MDPNEQGPAGGLAPHLTIRDGKAGEAIDFYARAFGAKEIGRHMAEDGKRVMHAHLNLNGAALMLNDDFPEMRGGGDAPAPAGVTLHLQVDDADKWWNRATGAGASVRFPLDDQFWGDRYGQVDDPFGFTWSIGSPSRK